MLKKITNSFIALCFALAFVGVTAHAQEEHSATQSQSPQGRIQLTQQQKNEITKLQKNILQQKKALIQKYVEYGVIPKAKGKEILSHLDEHMKHLGESGYGFGHHQHHHDFHPRHEKEE
ncbi:hypothetical protein GCM10011391_39320 [Pullulanibacillus camelliae]|uniref:DUF2680 domain-containing protein n=1 Tax=Pullulanibacillus camelliae TaxID=1707096 RepID=A0A8J3E001_9BACL|nr:DUF2680 domain-containing protein [Pullulanibacillus camelliae]GGE56546.1 hypothetical protein GCM10011391_39320 [Pullulanibacillus camelliae]